MSDCKLYWAYGSNLHVDQMRERCPAATVFGPLTIPNAVLRFRGVADVAYLAKAECPGGLWEITETCERALDLYEGINSSRPERGLYTKKYFKAEVDGKPRRILYYQMNDVGIMPPSQYYFDVIARGYRDFGLDLDRLEKALAHSWKRRRKTYLLRDRYRRKGAPNLARAIEGRPPVVDEPLPNPQELPSIGIEQAQPKAWLARCQAPHCWEAIDPETQICPYCGAWQTLGLSRRRPFRPSPTQQAQLRKRNER